MEVIMSRRNDSKFMLIVEYEECISVIDYILRMNCLLNSNSLFHQIKKENKLIFKIQRWLKKQLTMKSLKQMNKSKKLKSLKNMKKKS